jgi:serine/threonine-protein kinase
MVDRPSSEQLVVGACLAGKYQLERVLGRGGMGVVYAATNLALELRVAVKLIRPDFAEDPVVVARLLEEARCAAQITSEHVVRVLDVGRLESGTPFIAMEYVEGEDVYSLLERERVLPVEDAVSIVLEASIALAEAHHKGIVHRDLKPENLFLTRRADGSRLVKVLDFGISKRLGREAGPSLTTADTLIGSPDYMAPEQMRSPLGVDARADIWSLGAILYQLVTGRLPFDGATLADVCARVLEHEPKAPSAFVAELPRALDRVVLQCLSKDRARRFPSVHALARALEPFAQEPAKRALSAIARLSAAGTQSTPKARTSTHAVSVSNALPREATRPGRTRSLAFAAAALALITGSGFAIRNATIDAKNMESNAPVHAFAPTSAAPPALAPNAPSPLRTERTSAPGTALPSNVTSETPMPPKATKPKSRRFSARPSGSAPTPSALSSVESADAAPRRPSDVMPTKKSATDAWSLESFGGRR